MSSLAWTSLCRQCETEWEWTYETQVRNNALWDFWTVCSCLCTGCIYWRSPWTPDNTTSNLLGVHGKASLSCLNARGIVLLSAVKECQSELQQALQTRKLLPTRLWKEIWQKTEAKRNKTAKDKKKKKNLAPFCTSH